MAKKTAKDDSTKKVETLKGRLGSDIHFKDVPTKANGVAKKVATFSLAENLPGKDTAWHNVQLWEDKFPKNIKDIKKGDLVELKGNTRTFETKAGEGKTKTEFVATQVASHQAKKAQTENVKERVTLKGNLGQDPVVRKTPDNKTVAGFSIAIKKDGSDKPNWQQVQVWNEAIEKNKITNLKKGDFVELKGYYGKEYQNSKQETKQDLVLEESRVLKQAQEKELAPKKESGMKM
jgi:single-stranded DNA-binding protein